MKKIHSYSECIMKRLHEDMIAWKEGYALCLSIYKTTTSFPGHEKFGLVSQMRRSAYSIPLNLAEGNAKRTSGDKKRFFDIAKGSLEELHCQMQLSVDLGYLKEEQFTKLDDHLNRVSYLIYKLRKSWQ